MGNSKRALDVIRSTENQNETEKSSTENQNETENEENQNETEKSWSWCLCACWRRKVAPEQEINLKKTIKEYREKKKKSKNAWTCPW